MLYSRMLAVGAVFIVIFTQNLVCCRDRCLPRIVVSTFVRGTVFRAGTAGGQTLSVCTLPDFISRLDTEVSANIELGDGCSLLSVSEHACRSAGRRYIIDFSVSITCNDECTFYENNAQFRQENKEHRTNLVKEARARQRVDITVSYESEEYPVRLSYKKGRKTYSEECPGDVAGSVGSRLLCYCGPQCCPGDTVFQICGASCLKNCDSLDGPQVCTLECLSGCTCLDNLVRDGDRCILPAECPDSLCLPPPDVGTGLAVLTHYFYNGTSQRCEEFLYSGCGGNDNQFMYEDGCQFRCSDPRCRGDHVYSDCATSCGISCENYFLPPHLQPVCDGFCFEGCACPPGLIPLSSDPSDTTCARPDECPRPLCPPTQAFTECGSSCGITCENIHLPPQFQPVCALFCSPGCFCEEGLIPLGPNDDTCVRPDQCPTAVCSMEPDTIPCISPGARYFYNGTSGRCEQFRGCDCEGNNFDTLAQCQQRCEGLDCSAVLCVVPECDDPITIPGQCCTFCPDDVPSLPTIGPPLPPPPPPPPPDGLLCPGGKVYDSCGSACPRTCDSPEFIICTEQCVAGCFCPEGMVELGDRCVLQAQCPNDTCMQPADSGPCRGRFRRYYFNSETQRCEEFTYGGCDGNENNFETLEDCQARCPETQCPGDRVYIKCGTACPTTCDNRGILMPCPAICVEGCQCPPGTVELGDRCVEPDDCPTFRQCLQPIETGPCRGSFPSWGYNTSTGQCEEFIYGGCMGNENRFCTQEECEYVCDPCKDIKCAKDEDCLVYKPTGEAYCNPNCEHGSPCPPRQRCILEPVQCLVPPCSDERLCVLDCALVDCLPIPEGSCENIMPSDPDRGICCNKCDCPGDTSFEFCGSTCERTCDNLDDPQVCTTDCAPGCYCPNLIRLGDKCITPAECPDSLCLLPPDVGTGTAVLTHYFYNSTSQRCEEFLYSGCGGNDNQFESKFDCQKRCSDPRCRGDHVYSDCATSCGITCENYFLPPHLQPVCDFLCNEGCSCPPGLIPLRSSPQDSTLCVRPDECPRPERECPPTRVFTECGSSCGITCENIHLPPRFQPVCPAFCLRGCFCEEGLIPLGPNEDRCVRPDQCPTAVCSMEREMNPCLIPEERAFFNSTTGRCEEFTGCPGRGNNFNMLEQCQQICEALDCSAASCLRPKCDDPITVPGQCCAFCPDETVSEPPSLPQPSPRPLEPTPTPPLPLLPIPSPSPAAPPLRQCPNGKVFDICGSACPRGCDAPVTIVCPTVCVEGCFCRPGTVELGDGCVLPELCPVCQLPADPGPCEGAFPRYYFNSETRRCEEFLYGGCDGNANNFEILEDCQARCPETLCPGDRVYTNCGTACPTTCENRNNTGFGCPAVCVEGCQCPPGTVELGDRCVEPDDCPTLDQCLQPIETGPCRAFIPSWGYNTSTGQCEEFIYGGCMGNENRFCTQEECEYVCDPCTYINCGRDEDCLIFEPTGEAFCNPSCTNGDPCRPPDRCVLTPIPCFNPPCMDGRSCVLDCAVVRCARPPEGSCDNIIPRDPDHGICCDQCDCPGDTVFDFCGSSCPRACGTFDLDRACTLQCVPSCSCPDNLVRNGDSCIVPTECPDSFCLLPPDAGTGIAVLTRYFYNSTSQRCEKFLYSGCGGNDNQFESKLNCQISCGDPRCEGDLVYSDCTTSCGLNCDTVRQPELQPFCDSVCSEGCACPPGLIPLTSDLKETRCVPHDECPIPDCPPGQVYTDCGSSCGITCENVHLPSQFQPVCALVCSPGCFCEEGLIPLGPNDDTCVHPDQCPTAVCSMEGIVFPCLVPEERAFFDDTTGRCEKFTGCPGSGNNFDTLKQCQQICEALDCSAVSCLRPKCDDPITVPGQCCAFCPDETVSEPPSLPQPSPRPLEPTPTPPLPLLPIPSPSPSPAPPLRQCPNGKVFDICGSACPRGCDAPVTVVCPTVCVEGCFCRPGTVELGDGCVLPELCPVCQLPADPGPCEGAFPRYYFNSETRRCEEFLYGGCDGNANNFEILEDCQARCPETLCPGDRVYTNCGTACPTTCENRNNTGFGCPAVCVEGCQCPPGTVELGDRCVEPDDCPTLDQCLQPIETGPCRGSFPSWGYNTSTGQCEEFIYGGCMGNENRFCTQEECEYVCDPCTYANCGDDEDCLIFKPTGEAYCNPSCKRGNPCLLLERCTLEPTQCLIPPCRDEIRCELDCSAVLCARPICEIGELCTPPGQCCPVCQLPCDEGVSPVECLVDPCAGASCRQFPDAKCASDYCGGCNARWFQDGQEVECEIDCSTVLCAILECEEGQDLFTPPNECCPVCQVDCSAVTCPVPECDPEDRVMSSDGCCSICPHPCDDFNCSDRGYECQVYRPTGQPFCTPVCGPDSCDPGLQCFISTPPTCPTEPCPGILACDSTCPDGVLPVNCLVNPCDVSTCGVENAQCVPDYCGDCSAGWFVGVEDVTDQCSATPCPDGVTLVNCLVDPCQVSTCEGVPGAICVADYCGGCHDRWYVGDLEVTDQCACPDGVLPVNCLVNPCQVSTCEGIPGALCVANYCGGCHDRWYVGDLEVTDQCACPDGVLPVNCLVNPCQVSTCEGIPGALCVADYCGGCHDRWYVGDLEVTDQCACPDGVLPVNCLVNPCDGSTCGVENAQCVPDYCGDCSARWFVGVEDVTDQCSATPCPDGVTLVNCLVDPCQVSTCEGVPGAICVADYCGGCHDRWYVGDLEVTDQCACPDGVLPVNCLVNPCQVSTCEGIPGALCVADYCGGCHDRWYVGDLEVTDQCACPDGVLPVNCLVNPCQVSTCEGIPGALCVANYCGGCHDRWYVGDLEVTDQCACPDGVLPVNCLVNPCDGSTCGVENAQCVPDYCGDCSARWFVGVEDVTDQCSATPCPDGVTLVNCFVDPCQVSTCEGVPGAICVADYCGGCHDRWYVGDLEVTDQCSIPPDPCDNVRCPGGHQCQVDESTDETYCQPDCALDPCPPGQLCEVQPVFCGRPPCPGRLNCRVNCNLVDCQPITSADCNGVDVLPANPSIGRCCDICDPCDDFNCSDRGYECQVYRPTGQPFCTPVCGPDSCDPGLQCSISNPPTCPTEPCPGVLSCDPIDCSAVTCLVPECEGGILDTPPNECCPVCRNPCDDFNCNDRGYECQVYRPTGQPFCAPVCGPDSCDPGLQCSISPPPTCQTGPCPGTISCDSTCPDGVPPVNCLVNPCDVSTCGVEDAECVPDYCGDCSARWFVGVEEVTEQCSATPCSDGVPPVNCLVDPCQVSTCEGVPGALCVADYCGGCHDRWYVGDLEVTDQCDNCSAAVECPQIRCENSIPADFSEGRCCPTCPIDPCDNIRCPGGHRCEVDESTDETYCQPDCALDPCPPGQLCEVQPVFCGRPPCPGRRICRAPDSI